MQNNENRIYYKTLLPYFLQKSFNCIYFYLVICKTLKAVFNANATFQCFMLSPFVLTLLETFEGIQFGKRRNKFAGAYLIYNICVKLKKKLFGIDVLAIRDSFLYGFTQRRICTLILDNFHCHLLPNTCYLLRLKERVDI